jgi:hypothetical protein
LAEILDLPPSLLVSDLLKPGAEYLADDIAEADALYHGGKKFADRIEDFLVKRKIEDSNKEHYDLRKRRAFYVPYTGGLLDYIAAKALDKVLRIEAEGSDPYYESLLNDIDGAGTSLKTFAITCLIHAMLFRRAYVFPDFEVPAVFGEYEDDARLAMLEPQDIDDWQTNEKGHIEWVRSHTMELTRDPMKPYLPPEIETHYWTFFDSQNAYCYTASKPKNQSWGNDALAKIEKVKAHGLAECPVFNVHVGENMEIFDRVKSVAVALFNREASITWALDMAAYATLVLLLDTTLVKEIVSSELAALKLRVGESANYISPPPGIFEPLFTDADRLKANLMDVVRAQGVNAADLPQAGRLSGAAVNAMREPSESILRSFADPVLEAINRALSAIAKKRGTEFTVRVVLDEGGLTDGNEEPAGGDEPGRPGGADGATSVRKKGRGNGTAESGRGATGRYSRDGDEDSDVGV